MPFKPMLAATDDGTPPRFPVMASPKLDGVRCLGLASLALSRAFKAIPNGHVQDMFALRPWLQGLDGELIVGPANDPNVMQATMSGVMSREGAPAAKFYVFDRTDQLSPTKFMDRYNSLQYNLPADDPFAELVPHVWIYDAEQLAKYEQHCVGLGFEGVMYRDPSGLYKHGRSTLREGWLVKVKRFMDAEAMVIGYEELQHNQNAQTTDNLGHAKRSTHQAGKVAGGVLGALVCRTAEGVEFNIGGGFTAADRETLWAVRDSLVGKIVTYKFFPHGVKEAPRHPVFKAFRNPIDIGD